MVASRSESLRSLVFGPLASVGSARDGAVTVCWAAVVTALRGPRAGYLGQTMLAAPVVSTLRTREPPVVPTVKVFSNGIQAVSTPIHAARQMSAPPTFITHGGSQAFSRAKN